MCGRAAIVTCEKCGAEIAEGLSVCPQCESPVSVEQIGPVYVSQSAQPPDVIPAVPDLAVALKQQIYAGFWLRLAAYLIDTILISPFFGLIIAFRPAIFVKPPDPAATLLIQLPQPTLYAVALSIVISTVYFTLFEASSWQASPGKRILRLYVTDLQRQRVSFARAVTRNFTKVILATLFPVAHVLPGFTEKKQALHDLLTGSLVLRR